MQGIPGAICSVAFDEYPVAVPGHMMRHVKRRVEQIETIARNYPDDIRFSDLERITERSLAGEEMGLSGAAGSTSGNARAIEKNDGTGSTSLPIGSSFRCASGHF